VKNTDNEQINPEEWDLVIRPKVGWLDLNLAEVWRYRDLILLFVKRDFIAGYKQTILGPLWHLIQPVLTTITFTVVFTGIAGIPTDGAHPVVFYMTGITLWSYFTSCLTVTSSTFVANASIFGKVYFPRLVSPLASVLSALIKYLIHLSMLMMVMVFYSFNGYPISFSLNLMMLPFLVGVTVCFALGLGIIISSLTTKYRDFTVLVNFGVGLLMYATPVIYPLSYLKNNRLRWLLELNPLSNLFEAYRYIITGSGSFTIFGLAWSFAISLLVLFIGLLLFNRVEKTFMDTV
jgi:lipopolysaccharide transport system permease protein